MNQAIEETTAEIMKIKVRETILLPPSRFLRPLISQKFSLKRGLALLLLLLGLGFIAWLNDALHQTPNESRIGMEEHQGRIEEKEEKRMLSSQEMSQLGREIASRRDRLRDGCRRSPLPGKVQESLQKHIFYFFGHNTSVCLIGKTGTSTWRIHLRNINGGPPLDRPMDEDPQRRKLMAQPLNEVIRFFNSTVKILTVRHPLVRLVSAYRQKYRDGKPLNFNPKIKLIAGNTWHDNFEEFWLPAMLSNFLIPQQYYLVLGLEKPLNRSIRYEDWVYERIYHDLHPRITFWHFLHHVIRTFQEDYMDPHWDMYHEQCSVCFFDYDFIVKTENMSEEIAYIADKLGLNIDPHIRMNKSTNKKLFKSDFRHFATIPQWMRKKIYDIYADDMRLFNYDLPDRFLEEP